MAKPATFEAAMILAANKLKVAEDLAMRGSYPAAHEAIGDAKQAISDYRWAVSGMFDSLERLRNSVQNTQMAQSSLKQDIESSRARRSGLLGQ